MISDRQLYELTVSQKNFIYSCGGRREKPENISVFVIGMCYFDNSTLDVSAMKKAYKDLLRQNDAFRMRLVRVNGRIKQYFQDVEAFPEPTIRSFGENISDIEKYCADPKKPIIGVWDDFLTQAEILVCKDGTGALVLWQNHICSDGYSMAVVAYNQLNNFYEAYKYNKEPITSGKKYLFSDYVIEEKEEISQNKKIYKKWMKTLYNKNVSKYRVPLRSPLNTYEEKTICYDICGELYEKLKACCKSLACSETAVIMSAVAMVVNGLSGAKRFQFVSDVHGRLRFSSKNTAGPLLRDVPSFFDFTEDATVGDFVKKSHSEFIQTAMCNRFTYRQTERNFSILNYIFSRSLPGDEEWMTFNNLCSYTNQEDKLLRLITIKQKGNVNILNIDIENNINGGILLTCSYYSEIIPASKMKEYVMLFDQALKNVLSDSERSIYEIITEL